MSLYGIDFSFIQRAEGRKLKGYVPMRAGQVIGKSGVTVGTGVDLGQRTREEIRALEIPEPLKEKLTPYAERRREEAVNFLRDHPLELTDEEAEQLDVGVIHRDIRRMATKFESDSGFKFGSMPWQVQTVLASLAVNLGPNLYISIPRTWKTAINRDWVGLFYRLDNFPSKQPELTARRKREAGLIAQLIR